MLTLPTDEEYRWLASQWYMNRRQRILLMSNSRGRKRKRIFQGNGRPTNVNDDLIILPQCEVNRYGN
ncbi:hypothetical protein J2736_006742 [Paenibacillus qinlingensis]|uniref:Uncharacterized protein n=1 Tax=Paenibacillus qinlingensis TaxID=1837343 RepID=A0ABU1P6V1_9BACL|nr:hypothetical protein [Paenibacillus qinlingensis]